MAITYPCYRKSESNGAIILFSSRDTGVCVSGNNGACPKGQESSVWINADSSHWQDVTLIEDWLGCLPAGYDELALARFKAAPLARNASSMTSALMDGFEWGWVMSERGFWSAICQHYLNGIPLPPLPAATGILKGPAPLVFYTDNTPIIGRLIGISNSSYKYATATERNNGLDYGLTGEEKGEYLSPADFAAKVVGFKPAWKDKMVFQIGSHKVILKEGGIHVGCQEISYADFKELMREIRSFNIKTMMRSGYPITPVVRHVVIAGESVKIATLEKIESEVLGLCP